MAVNAAGAEAESEEDTEDGDPCAFAECPTEASHVVSVPARIAELPISLCSSHLGLAEDVGVVEQRREL